MPSGRCLAVYFAGWNLPKGVEAACLPWNAVTDICHAFWAVEPVEGEETSFQRRASGLGPREQFRIVPLHPELDFGCQEQSHIEPGLLKNHFAQYAALTRRYPGVRVLISIGGWTRSGYFSEMAYTAQGRSGFIRACLHLMHTYPWIGGIDLDWEYPAGGPGGERESGEPDDEGCPIFGTAQEDRENFILLLRELREAFDREFGPGMKALTACAVGDPQGLACQDWAGAAPYLDRIQIMTYDLAGIWSGKASHTSSASQAVEAAAYLMGLGIPGDKLCVGSPLYASPMRLTKPAGGEALGAEIEGERPANLLIGQSQIRAFEAQAVSGYTLRQEQGRWRIAETFGSEGPGWHMGCDFQLGGAYLWNDDPGSPYDRWFLSYENPLSLQAKLDAVRNLGLAGIIVWEASSDTSDYVMLRQMCAGLIE